MPSVGDTFTHYQLDAAVERPATIAADTFEATNTKTGASVLLEILRDGVTGVERARFGTRARRLQSVTHPSLLAVVEVGAAHCALEAPPSRSLEKHAGIAIARTRQKLLWLSQIASALAALHKAGIVHGGLSLSSISVASDLLVKLSIPVGGDVSGSPLEDVRAFIDVACELLIGIGSTRTDANGFAERTVVMDQSEGAITARLRDAGTPEEAAAMIARIRTGASMTSADLASSFAPFADYTGPMTERLVPIAPSNE